MFFLTLFFVWSLIFGAWCSIPFFSLLQSICIPFCLSFPSAPQFSSPLSCIQFYWLVSPRFHFTNHLPSSYKQFKILIYMLVSYVFCQFSCLSVSLLSILVSYVTVIYSSGMRHFFTKNKKNLLDLSCNACKSPSSQTTPSYYWVNINSAISLVALIYCMSKFGHAVDKCQSQ